jgi:hypothetical protein
MMIVLFNIFNLVSYIFYVVVIFRLHMIYGSGLGQHGAVKSRHALRSE